MPDNVIFLNDDIVKLKGVGAKKKEQLEAAGIATVQDLLDYYPIRYKDRRKLGLIFITENGSHKEKVMGLLSAYSVLG